MEKIDSEMKTATLAQIEMKAKGNKDQNLGQEEAADKKTETKALPET